MTELGSSPPTTEDIEVLQAKTVRVLQGGVVLGGMAMTSSFAAAALAGKELTGSETWGVIAGVSLSIGGTLAAIPLAVIMSKSGRRQGLVAGYSAGIVGGVLSFLSIVMSFFPFLLLGMVLIGAGQASNLAARYAGADLATDRTKATAIGNVMWAGTIGSVLGPVFSLSVASPALEALGFDEYAGSYIAGALLFVVASVIVHRNLRPDPLHVAGGDGTMPSIGRPGIESIRHIVSNYGTFLAVAGMALGQAVMVGIMAVTSLHMDDGDQSKLMISLVISLHIVGMFMFSPIVGRLVDRIGPHLVITGGALQLFAGAQIAAQTQSHELGGHLIGLFLVGTGWSFCVIAGSALLTSSTPTEQRVGVQATADFLMTLLGAVAGVTSGRVVEVRSFKELSNAAAMLAVALLVFALVALVRNPRNRTPEPGMA